MRQRFILLFFFSLGIISLGNAQSKVLKLNSNHLSIDLEVYDKVSFYYLVIHNKSSYSMEVSVSIQVNTKCGETKTYTTKTQLAANKSNDDGQWSGAIKTSKECQGGIQSATITSMSVKNLSQEREEQEAKQKKTSQNEAQASIVKSQTSSPAIQTTNQSSKSSSIDQNKTKAETRRQQEEYKRQTEQAARQREIEAAAREERERAITSAVTEGTKLISGIISNIQAEREAREEQERIRAMAESSKIEELKSSRIARTNLRTNLIKRYAEVSFPSSSTEASIQTLYYFIYACDSALLPDPTMAFYLSAPFPITRFSDGSWPYKNTILKEVSSLTPQREILHGGYLSKAQAQRAYDLFREILEKSGVRITPVTYSGKNGEQKKPAAQKTDFWGNPVPVN